MAADPAYFLDKLTNSFLISKTSTKFKTDNECDKVLDIFKESLQNVAKKRQRLNKNFRKDIFGTKVSTPVFVSTTESCGTTESLNLNAFIQRLKQDMCLESEKWKQKYHESHIVVPIYDSIFIKASKDSICAGEKRCEMVRSLLGSFSFKRSLDQIKFTEAMLVTCLPIIYGQDFEPNRTKLLKQINKEEFPMACAIMCPRRWGKTMSMSMFIAVILYVCSNIKIVIITTGQKISSMVLDEILLRFSELENTNKRVLVRNHKKACIKNYGYQGTNVNAYNTGQFNTIQACSSNLNGLKGLSANIFLIDEAARINPQVLSEGVAPMLVVKNTVMIMISTNLGPDNFFSRLFTDMEKRVRRLFLFFHVDLLCELCREAKIDPKLCNHNDDKYPPWLSSSNREQSKIFMDSATYLSISICLLE